MIEVTDHPPALGDIPDAEALGVPIHVISAATERGLVRGISHFGGFPRILPEVKRAVGVLTEVADWAKARYHMPSYLLDGWEIDGGIYLFPWTPATAEHWRDPDKRRPAREGQLLYLPSGWVNHTVHPRRP